MSGTLLKLIGLLSMIIDHIGLAFFYKSNIFRIIGRISFPIYAFLIASGCKKTKNIYKYFFRLISLAIISEIPYDLMVYGKLSILSQNSVFTLSLGCLCIIIFKDIKDLSNKIIMIVAVLSLGNLMSIDYGSYGIFMILILYIFNDNKNYLVLSFLLINLLISIQATNKIEYFSYFSIIPIIMYDENKKIYNKTIKNMLYILYPFHMLIIALIYKVYFNI